MAKTVRRLLGLTFSGKPIFEPTNTGSAIVFAAAGGWKTTGVSIPALMSALSDQDRALFINDVKNGEIAAQIADMCRKYGRKFGVNDDVRVFGPDYPRRISLNPLGALLDAAARNDGSLLFAIENTTHTLIDEPGNDQKNFYWRESPRELIAFAVHALVRRNPRLATPGGLYSLIGDPELWNACLSLEAEDGDETTQILARQLINAREHDVNYAQHVQAALSALKIFAPGSPLHGAGRHAELTHRQLIEEGWVVCFVNPIRYANRMGPYFALHLQALMDAQLLGTGGRAEYILDECTNAPLRSAVKRVTVFRAFGARALYIVQSRQDLVQTYGEKETAILEENCTVKQYLKFSNFEEAERVSRAMGEAVSVSRGMGVNSEKLDISGNLSTGKERLFTADELMRLPADEQIIHVSDVGWIHCKKIRQNQIAPYCYDLADNPLEGGCLPPDPKVTLDTNGGRR